MGREPEQVQRPRGALGGVELERQRAEHTEVDDLGRVGGKAGLGAEVVGAHHDLVERGVQARPLAGFHLQGVEFEHQIVGGGKGLVRGVLTDQEHSGDVDAGDHLLGSGGDVDQHVLDGALRQRPSQLRHPSREVVPVGRGGHPRHSALPRIEP